MSDITSIEKRHFERLLQMAGGYVLIFPNRTFAEFVTDSVGCDIYDARYAHASGSQPMPQRRTACRSTSSSPR